VKRLLTAMVTDERGRDVPVVRELRWPPGPIKLLRKQPPLPMLTRRVAISYWVGAVYLSLKAGVITVLWLKLSTGGGGSLAVVVQGTGTLLLMGLWPVPLLALVGWTLWVWRGRRNAARFTASRGACPSCGDSLLGTMEQQDGHVMCGSCDAAWKLGSPEVCPGCEYDLLGAHADADDILNCPECGLALPGANAERLRHDAVLLHGGMRDDAGISVPKRSDTKRKRAAIKSRPRAEVWRPHIRLLLLSVLCVAIVFLVPPFVGAPVENMCRRVMSERAAGFVFGATIISIWSACGIVLFVQIRRASAVASRRLAICPACDTDMRAVMPHTDGLTPCPNCGAAWKLASQPIV